MVKNHDQVEVVGERDHNSLNLDAGGEGVRNRKSPAVRKLESRRIDEMDGTYVAML